MVVSTSTSTRRLMTMKSNLEARLAEATTPAAISAYENAIAGIDKELDGRDDSVAFGNETNGKEANMKTKTRVNPFIKTNDNGQQNGVSKGFGAWVRDRRVAAGGSQAQLATACGVTAARISEVERGVKGAASARLVTALKNVLKS